VDPVIPPPPPPAARFTLALAEGTDHTMVQGDVLALTLEVTRDPGFVGPVTFSATPPPGVFLVFRPNLVITRPASEIRLVVDSTVERTLHRIVLRGTDDAGATHEAVLALTVNAGD